ncbi:MAG: TM2 domain-containing protein [Erysipelotrichaceae bacterium]|nr:TM2 domain-containing protein [Erysipelotrichaceae bacterium]
MDKQNIDMYLTANAKYFEPSAIPVLRQKLERADDEAFTALQASDLKDPTAILLISIFLGGLGIDRFMVGDTGMGVLKLLTGGCCGILTIIDWFTISKKAKQKNLATISMIL